MTPGSMDFGGPMGFRKAAGYSGPSRGPMSSKVAHRNDIKKSTCDSEIIWRTPNFDQKNRYNFGEDLFFWRPKKPLEFR